MEAQTCPDAVRIAIASLVKMINLLASELIVGTHRDDIDALEQNVRAKLFAHLPGVSTNDTAAGVALAHSLVEPLLVDLRERAKKLTPTVPADIKEPKAASRLN